MNKMKGMPIKHEKVNKRNRKHEYNKWKTSKTE